MSLIGPQSTRGQVAVLNHQRQGDSSYRNGKHRQSNVHDDLTCRGQHRQSDFSGGTTHMDLWYWLINHSVSRHEIDKKPTAFLFDLYKWKNPQANERKATLDCGKRESWPMNQFPDLRLFADSEPLE